MEAEGRSVKKTRDWRIHASSIVAPPFLRHLRRDAFNRPLSLILGIANDRSFYRTAPLRFYNKKET